MSLLMKSEAILTSVRDQALVCSVGRVDDESLTYEKPESVSLHYDLWMLVGPEIGELIRSQGF